MFMLPNLEIVAEERCSWLERSEGDADKSDLWSSICASCCGPEFGVRRVTGKTCTDQQIRAQYKMQWLQQLYPCSLTEQSNKRFSRSVKGVKKYQMLC